MKSKIFKLRITFIIFLILIIMISLLLGGCLNRYGQSPVPKINIEYGAISISGATDSVVVAIGIKHGNDLTPLIPQHTFSAASGTSFSKPYPIPSGNYTVGYYLPSVQGQNYWHFYNFGTPYSFNYKTANIFYVIYSGSTLTIQTKI